MNLPSPTPSSSPGAPPPRLEAARRHPLDRLSPPTRSRAAIVGRTLAAIGTVALVVGVTAGVVGPSRAVEPLASAVVHRSGTLSEKETARLERRLAAVAPRGTWVVIDTYRNRLRVHRDDAVFHEAVCSTGSGAVVRDPRNGRIWIFDTPIGERRVQRKVKDPVWNKPDWAFIEEGFVPPKGGRERYDDFSLGEYGLYLGDGYIIHGTIFQSLLGQAITHGCVRLGDKDLELVYRQVPLGARVYLY